MSKVAIVFWSATGNTETMANCIAEGAGAAATIVPCAEMDAAKLGGYDVVAFGCPAMGAEQLEESEFEPMFAGLEGSLNGKKVALFGSYGWGDGQWMRDWCERVKEDGAQLFSDEGLICNETPDDDVQAACRKLACQYCFAEEGEYHGRRALMSFEVGKKALDFLIANSGNRRNLEVDFFGGEPLMNWQVVKDLVAYGREQEKLHDKNFRFTLTTNGVLLNDEIMEFCNKEMANVVLSIDGRKEVHDKMRPFRKGAGSYDLIVPKFQKFAESRHQDKYYVRGTFTHYNPDFAADVLHLADLGFKQISVEPVVAEPSEPYAITEEDLPQLFEEYDKLAAEMVRRHKEGDDFNFFHFMIDLEGGPCVAKRLSGCGSGTEYLAVTPWGDFYPCHQFVGNEKFLLGNVDEGIKNTEIRDEFKCCNVYAKEKCRKCFARFYCSGGCAANAYNFSGDICGAYDIGCELQKKRIECAIMIKAAEADCE